MSRQTKRQILNMVQDNQITPEQGKQMLLELQSGNSQEEERLQFFQPVWTTSALDSTVEVSQASGSLLIFDDNRMLVQLMEEHTGPAKRLRCIGIEPGESYSKVEENTYQIRPGNPEDYLRLLADVQLDKLEAPQILHGWSQDDTPVLNIEQADKQLGRGFYSLLYLTQALLRFKIKSPLPLLYLHSSMPAHQQPLYAAVGGLIRTIRQEEPNFRFKSVHLEQFPAATGMNHIESARMVQILLGELSGNGGGSREVKYAADVRKIPTLQAKASAEFNQDIPLVQGGTYLITGGCGGLGSLVAKYLASRYKANLVLNGRSPADGETGDKLQELQHLGASAVYVQADLAAEADTRQLILAAKAKFGALNGIFHCAGQVQDGFLINKKKELAELVLAPKIIGTIHLDQAAADEKLDIFVLFSSISALLGNTGQGDYAYANAFMDHFAQMRNAQADNHARHGKTLSINWPLWANGGMAVSQEQADWMKHSLNISVMEDAQGLTALETALRAGSGVHQILAVSGKGSSIAQGLLKLYHTTEAFELPASEFVIKAAEGPASSKLKAYAEKLLMKLLAKVTKYPVSGIKAELAFEHYGVDSMIVMAMNRELEADFGELSKTLLFEYQNIAELAGYLAGNHSEVLTRLAGGEAEVLTGTISIESASRKEQKMAVKQAASRFAGSATAPAVPAVAQPEEETAETGDIAVIGVSGRYPLARNIDEFWDNLKNGRDCITEIPQDRWNALAAYTQDINDKSKSYSKWGGFIADADRFDPLFFSISPKEASVMDPQERIFLETVWQTLEDAGYSKSSLNHAKAGVFVGVMYGQYQLFGADIKENALAPTSSYASIANRVSYFFNFHGPSIALDTMCSSSLTAVHLACDSIRRGESEVAVAGGVNLSIHPQKYLMLSQQRFLSTDGRCRTFGEGGDGYVPGEGSGAVLLKPLSKAVADGDRIYAVIKGSTMNHGGKTNGYSVPNPNAQADLIAEALNKTGIHPRTISYMEAHGTGTSLGDPIEITGLSKAFGNFTGDTAFCAIGSVKSNIGHAESAAGIAGLTKLLLQFQHRLLVPSLHSETPNPNIRFDRSPFSVQRELTEWKRPVVSIDGEEREYPLRAGISAFGAGGANVHVLLEEYRTDAVYETAPEAAGPQLVVMSAQNRERLVEYAEEMARFVNKALNGSADGSLFGTVEPMTAAVKSPGREKLELELASITSVVLKLTADILHLDVSELEASASLQDGLLQGNEFIRLAEELYKHYAWPQEVHELISAPSLASVVERIAERSACLEEIQLTAAAIETPACIVPAAVTPGIPAPRLADLAFTLQQGREEMDERLALVVSSLTELRDKLSRYVHSGADSVSLFEGNTKAEGIPLRSMLNGEALSSVVEQLLIGQELQRLAALWVSGIHIDWTRLYPDSRIMPRKISLPAYPFAKERHWVDTVTGAGQSARRTDIAQETPHPLLDMNASTLRVQSFSKVLDRQQWHWREHNVSGHTLWPGAAYLEMARAAGNLSHPGHTVREIRNVVWRQPLFLTDASTKLSIELLPQENRVEYAILNEASDGERLLLGSGELVYEEPDAPPGIPAINIEEIRHNCSVQLGQEQIYSRFEQFGMSYGPAFQSLEQLACSPNEVLSLLSLPDKLAGDGGAFGLHPSLLDGAFQTVAGLAWANPQAGGQPYLPFSAGRITLYSYPVDTCRVYVQRADSNGTGNSGFQTVHMYILDLEDRVMVEIRNFTLKRLAEPAEPALGTSSTEDMKQELLYCRPVWEEASGLSGPAAINGKGSVLLIGGSPSLANNLQKSGKFAYIEAVRSVHQRSAGDGDGPQAGHPADYGQLLTQLRQEDRLPELFLFSFSETRFTWDVPAASGQLNDSLYELFAFCKALTAGKVKPHTRLFCLYHNDRNEVQPLYASLNGFVRTLQLEYPQLHCKVIEVKNTSSDSYEDSEIILQESAPSLVQDIEVRYEGTRRFVKQLREMEVTDHPLTALPLVEGGTYIITGGLGGLGLIFARYLSAKVRCNLVLTGRSAVNESIERRLSEIGGPNAHPVYIQADITVKQDVRLLLDQVKQHFGHVDGLIHSAGNIRDALIVNKSRQNIEEVIQPKVQGTLILDEALQHEPLAFFALFSSMVGLQGNAGQCDYAYANSFLEHYAEVRAASGRPGKTVAIHWPQWADGGMKPDEMTTQRLKQAGISPLGTEQGIEAFELALRAQDCLNVGVLSGNRSRISEALQRFNGKLLVTSPVQQHISAAAGQAAGNSAPSKNVKQLAEQLLREAVAGIVKLPAARVDIRESFERYGLDSVMSMDLTRELERVFGELPKTLFFEYRTLSALAEHFAQEYTEVLNARGRVNGRAANTVLEPLNQPKAMSGSAVRETTPHSAARFLQGGSRQSMEELQESQDIAIIGLSGKYPMADTLEQFWANLQAGKDCITEIPADRWDYRQYYDPGKDRKGKTYSKWGGFINDADKFDPLFFQISPRDAVFMDPQERLFLETVWRVIEDSGYSRQQLDKHTVGMFAGVMYGQYQLLGAEEYAKGNDIVAGSSHAFVANRASYFFNFTGPSIAVDTMCSSSLTAIHLACDSIRRGECELAVAGGVNLSIHPHKYLLLSQSKFTSSDGKCRSFGEGGDGYVPGEGAGAVLLKPLGQAVKDRDNIYGVIKGTALNHGGRTTGVTVPNPAAQSNVISAALSRARIDPLTVSYIEAHGTGTALGDPLEISGLVKAYDGDPKQPVCAIGSVKSNIGHLESAAGIAALTKVLLQLKYGQLVPSIHADTTNAHIKFEDTRFRVQRELAEWSSKAIDGSSAPRRAGISSFGAGGSNAHLVVEEFVASGDFAEDDTSMPQMMILSAKDAPRLRQSALLLRDYLTRLQVRQEEQKQASFIRIQDIAFTLQTGREAMAERLAMVVHTAEEAVRYLNQYIEGMADAPEWATGSLTEAESPWRLGSDDEDVQYIRSVIKSGNLNKLIRLWVNGTDIGWEALHGSSRPRRISLPGHPFESKRYWIEQKGPRAGSRPNSLHPLIDSIDAHLSLGEGIVFQKSLDVSQPLLKDHQVLDQPVLAGAFYLTLVQACAGILAENSGVRLSFSQIVWREPLLVSGQPHKCRVALKPGEQGVQYEISSLLEGRTVIHCTGSYALTETEASALNNGYTGEQWLPIDEIKQQSEADMGKEALYQTFTRAGLSYGPLYQTVEHLWSSPSTVLGRISWGGKDELEQDSLHPSMLDGALQTIAGFAFTGSREQRTPAMPFSIERLEMLSPIADNGYTYVQKAGEQKYHIAIADDEGRVCLKLYGVTVREPRHQEGKEPSFYYVPGWQAAPAMEHHPAAPRKGGVLIFSSPEDLAAAVALKEQHTALAPEGPAPVIVQLVSDADPALAEKQPSSSVWMNLDTSDASALKSLLESCQSTGLASVYFLAGLQLSSEYAEDIRETELAEELGVLSFFRLLKALSAQVYASDPIEIRVVTSNTFKVEAADRINPQYAALQGLVKSAGKEFPHWQLKMIDLDLAGAVEALHSPMLDGLYSTISEPYGPGDEVAIREGQAYIRTLVPAVLPEDNRSLFRDNGVYLILGGAGGIGLELSRYLARGRQARIALLGRRELSRELSVQLQEIEALGGEVLYIQADAMSSRDLRQAVQRTKQRFGALNGVIHSAIVLEDRTLVNMDEPAFRRTLGPKVSGSVILSEAVRDEALDFMLFFSSAQSFIGNRGQSNYAAACTFKDAFAQYLQDARPYPVKIVNWGYWGSVGAVASRDYSKRLEAQGIYSIQPTEGMAAVERILTSPFSQVLYIKAAAHTMRQMGAVGEQQFIVLPQTGTSGLKTVGARLPAVQPDQRLLNRQREGLRELEALAVDLLIRSLQQLGWTAAADQRFEHSVLRQQLGIDARYFRLFDSILSMLNERGLLEQAGTSVVWRGSADTRLDEQQLTARRDQLLAGYPELGAFTRLLWACLQSYPGILAGRINPVEIMFPKGSKSLVEDIYKGHYAADYYNRLVADTVLNYVQQRSKEHSGRPVRILEIGAGTGGTSRWVLEALRPHQEQIQYIYTDISPGFLAHGRREYGDLYPFLEFKLFNAENEPQPQGLETGSIDLVLATNVLHATKHVGNTLQQVKQLLARGGLVVINELTANQIFSTLTFGLTDGWWLFNDAGYRLADSPLLSVASWSRLLAKHGYTGLSVHGFPDTQPERLEQAVIVAASDGVIPQSAKQPSAVLTEPALPKPATAAESAPSLSAAERAGKTAGASAQNVREEALRYVKRVFAEVLHMNEQEFDIQATFETYGVDSLVVMDINKQFEQQLGTQSSTLLFEYMTLDALAGYFSTRYAEYFGSLGQTAAEKAMPPQQAQNPVRLFSDYEPEQGRNGTASNTEAVVSPSEAAPGNSRQDIAVIGLSGIYPGAETQEQFWELLCRGNSAITEIPRERWDASAHFSRDRNEAGKSYSKWGGFIEGADTFDPLFFNITPAEAETMDPQERLFLQTVWALFEDAGYTSARRAKDEHRVGVFAGAMNSHYEWLGGAATASGSRTFARSSYWSIANRISYFFNLSGPSMAVDTACSSSLTALHLACESIRRGECRTAVAGGVNLILHPMHYERYSMMNMISGNDECRSFGEGADGFVDGEGVGAVLLKPLEQAIRDHDYIYGIIKGSSLNAGGKTGGYLVPNPSAQAAVIRETLMKSGVEPETVSYIEAHGTGTALGDPIEIAALNEAFGTSGRAENPCVIGSVKSNIGHLESASGMAGLTKVLLQMKYRTLVPSLHSSPLNPRIHLEGFKVQQELEEWTPQQREQNGILTAYPRRAGLSSFGAGGANAHVIIEEYDNRIMRAQAAGEESGAQQAIILSAKNEEGLQRYASSLAEQLRQSLQAENNTGNGQSGSLADRRENVTLQNVAYTLQLGREALEVRLAFVVSGMEQLLQYLQAYLEDSRRPAGMYVSNIRKPKLSTTTPSGQLSVSQCIREQRLEELVRLWADGVPVPWQELHAEPGEADRPDIIRLTPYPFAKERYWIPDFDVNSIYEDHSSHSRQSVLDEQDLLKLFTEVSQGTIDPIQAEQRIGGTARG